ncbi:MAG: hypothetical protein PHN98_02620 [Smithellaceae bacterium]|jgi:hypothetical protein|nr:hypothetical protein [Smithellaceae bacterium]
MKWTRCCWRRRNLKHYLTNADYCLSSRLAGKGESSLCRTKMLTGKVYHPGGVKLRKSDRAFGYIHPFVAYPITDLEILL